MQAEQRAGLPPRSAPPIARSSLHYRMRPAAHRKAVPTGWVWAAHVRRFFFVAVLVVQTLFAVYFMLAVLPYHGGTLLEIALAAAFGASFGWVSLGGWLALSGFFIRLMGGDRKGLLARTSEAAFIGASLAPTAILMPIYEESVAQSLAGLAAAYRSLERTGELKHFEFFILSDSRDPETWLAEQAGWAQLVRMLGGSGRIHYRRRRLNLKHKSGNIADFMRRWGRKYRYFMILDADSLMEGETIKRMVRLMQCHERVGILQAPPRIVSARSPFARIQQFANCLYGPLFTTGLAAIQLGDGAYWGHNALIRTNAFMDHCAIANLRGIGLFRGAVMSHDFVEAAFIRRGGYEVWLEPGLEGSYEESPPTLVDELARDRRWAKGNLQHLALMLGGRGLALAHRFTFLNGVLAYAAAPLWLAFLALSAAEVAQFTLFPIDYFPAGHNLIPVWPEWHPEWAIRLVASTAFVLFLPKLLAFLDAFVRGPLRRGFGGSLRLTAGVVLESIASMLLAPIRMLAHTHFVLEAAVNLHIRWAGQNRGGELGWWASLRMHGFGVVLGVGWSWFAWWLKPLFLYWSLPVTLPLILAPIVSVLLSRHRLGDWLGRTGLFGTPEDKQRPDVIRECDALPQDIGDPGKMTAFERSLLDPEWNEAARICGNRRRAPVTLVEKALAKGPDALDRDTKALLAGNEAALSRLHREVRSSPAPRAWHPARARLECSSVEYRRDQTGPSQDTCEDTAQRP
ncbi:MAG: glucans biosynthesis glucosyltransferase MdoH [Gammaproteobacteria bacterium]|nr:glucans biosynthesis glucosyltransferase MdoH [Gammaproteobacteria bacterium]